MSKLIYITESQLRETIEGDGAWLNPEDSNNEFKLGGMQVSTGAVTGSAEHGDVELPEPVVGDAVADRMTKRSPLWGSLATSRGTINCSVKKKAGSINEANSGIDGKTNKRRITKQAQDTLSANIRSYTGNRNTPGVKRVEDILKNDGMVSYNNAEEILSQMNDGTSGLERFDVDGSFKRSLESITKNEKAKSKIGRDNRKQMGLPVLNVTNRDGSKGGAHTSATTNTTQQIYGKN
jgi:hypothetical protein